MNFKYFTYGEYVEVLLVVTFFYLKFKCLIYDEPVEVLLFVKCLPHFYLKFLHFIEDESVEVLVTEEEVGDFLVHCYAQKEKEKNLAIGEQQ